jgi:hypothetical protein
MLATMALVIAAVVMLRRIGGPAAGVRDPLALFPSRCEAVVVVPELGRTGARIGALARTRLADLAASLAGFQSTEQLLAELGRQAGFDFRSPESMRAAGLDPAGPLAVYLPLEGAPVAALPPGDRSRLEALVARLAADRSGATHRGQAAGGAQPIVTFSAEGSPEPALAYVIAQGFLLVSAGPRCVAALEAILALKPEGSLAREPRLAAARGELERGEAYAFLCPGSARSQRLELAYGLGAGLSLAADEVRLSSDIPLSDDQAKALASFAEPAGADLVSKLEPGAFFVARLGGDPRILQPFAAFLVPPAFQAAMRRADLDVSGEILGNLKPGVAASLSLSPSASLEASPELDPRLTNPFQLVHLTALGRSVDEGRARATLEKIAAVAPRFGAQMESRELQGTRVLASRYHLGEGASLALRDGLVLVTGGPGQMDALLQRLSGEGGLVLANPGATQALARDGFALFLDIGRLVASLRALPDSAYGVGGFAIKAAASRYLDAVGELAGLRLSGRVERGRLHAELALSLNLSPAQKKEPQAP